MVIIGTATIGTTGLFIALWGFKMLSTAALPFVAPYKPIIVALFLIACSAAAIHNFIRNR